MLTTLGVIDQITPKNVTNKNFFLVNWKIVTALVEQGGIGIKEPALMNRAMVAKIFWILLFGEDGWWKIVLRKKYFYIPILRCSDHKEGDKYGSLIWILCSVSLALIQKSIMWNPKNGNQIRIWKDSIEWAYPLSKVPDLKDLKKWMTEN